MNFLNSNNRKRSFFIISFFSLLLPPVFFLSYSYFFFQPTVKVAPEIKRLSLTFVGDLMCHQPQFEAALVAKDSFNFAPVYDYCREILSGSDVTFGNLETVLGGKERKYTGYPDFNSPDAYVTALPGAGFDFLFTSNNHSFDRGEAGVLRTIEQVRKAGLMSTGSFTSIADRDSIRLIEKNGFTIAVVAFSYSLNGKVLPKGKDYLVNIYDTIRISQQINLAKEKRPDLILAYFHWGDEYQIKQNKYQEYLTEFATNKGADLIIGSHPHVLQPIMFNNFTGRKINRGITVYSLGNFVSNQQKKFTDAGGIIRLELTKSDSLITLDTVRFTSTWVFKGKINGRTAYRVIPLNMLAEQPEKFPFLSKTQIDNALSITVQSRAIIQSYYSGKDSLGLLFR